MIPPSSCSETWHFLNQEAYLIASSLGNGLTALRQAPGKGKGEWYAAFFQLSIGLERLMKATIIVDHINRHQLGTLTTKVLKNKYGHDLLTLLESVGQLDVATKPNPVSSIDKQSTAYQILEFLSRFADKARYHNLDRLTGSQSGVDPLADWGAVLSRIVSKDVPEATPQKIEAGAALLGPVVARMAVVIANDLDKTPLSPEQFIQATPLHEAASGYAVCHVLEIARPLEAVLHDLTHASYGAFKGGIAQVPDMWEHLTFLRVTKRSEIRRKKRWG